MTHLFINDQGASTLMTSHHWWCRSKDYGEIQVWREFSKKSQPLNSGGRGGLNTCLQDYTGHQNNMLRLTGSVTKQMLLEVLQLSEYLIWRPGTVGLVYQRIDHVHFAKWMRWRCADFNCVQGGKIHYLFIFLARDWLFSLRVTSSPKLGENSLWKVNMPCYFWKSIP